MASAVTALAVVVAAALGKRLSPPLFESTGCEPSERNAKLSVPSALLRSTEGWARVSVDGLPHLLAPDESGHELSAFGVVRPGRVPPPFDALREERLRDPG